MTDEEKKAIERLNKRYEFFKENPLATNVWLTLDIHNLGIVLNITEKQSKEIEELNKSDESKEQSSMKYYNLYKELVDKIKAKIEEVDIQLQKLKDGLTGRKTNFVNKNMLFAQKKALQSLLEKE